MAAVHADPKLGEAIQALSDFVAKKQRDTSAGQLVVNLRFEAGSIATVEVIEVTPTADEH